MDGPAMKLTTEPVVDDGARGAESTGGATPLQTASQCLHSLVDIRTQARGGSGIAEAMCEDAATATTPRAFSLLTLPVFVARYLGRFFSAVAMWVLAYPWAVCAVAALMLGASVGAFFGLQTMELDSNELWNPTDMDGYKSLQRIAAAFPDGGRKQQILFHADGNDVLSLAFLLALLDTHERARRMWSWEEFCARPVDWAPCPQASILAVWNFSRAAIEGDGDHHTSLMKYLNGTAGGASLSYNVKCSFNTAGGTIERVESVVEIWEYADKYRNDLHRVEGAIIDYALDEWPRLNTGVTAEVMAESSFDRELRSILDRDFLLIIVSIVLVIGFTALVLGDLTLVGSRVLLGSLGALVMFSSYVIGVGILIFCGEKTTPVTPLVMFVLVGIGVDDMFIIVDAYSLNSHIAELKKRMARALATAGPAITLTTLSDICAFGVGASATMPGVRAFTLTALVVLTVDFLLQVTVFVLCLHYDQLRIQANRMDLFFWVKLPHRWVTPCELCCGKRDDDGTPSLTTTITVAPAASADVPGTDARGVRLSQLGASTTVHYLTPQGTLLKVEGAQGLGNPLAAPARAAPSAPELSALVLTSSDTTPRRSLRITAPVDPGDVVAEASAAAPSPVTPGGLRESARSSDEPDPRLLLNYDVDDCPSVDGEGDTRSPSHISADTGSRSSRAVSIVAPAPTPRRLSTSCHSNMSMSRRSCPTENVSLSRRLINKYYAPCITSKWGRVVVLCVFLAWAVTSATWYPKVGEGHGRGDTLPADSYVIRYQELQEDYFSSVPTRLTVLLDDPLLDYADAGLVEDLAHMKLTLESDPSVAFVDVWLLDFVQWRPGVHGVEGNSTDTTGTHGAGFYDHLIEYLHDRPELLKLVVLDDAAERLRTVRFLGAQRYVEESDKRMADMDRVRAIYKAWLAAAGTDGVISAPWHAFEDANKVIRRMVFEALLFAIVAILGVLLAFMPPLMAVLVSFTVVLIDNALLGAMYPLGIKFHAVSYIVIAMSVGLSVDYCAHIGIAFTNARLHEGGVRADAGFRTAPEYVREALHEIGSSVLSGGFSTLLGVAALGFATSETFLLFFKLLFCSILFGIVHGFVFLPALLACMPQGLMKYLILPPQ